MSERVTDYALIIGHVWRCSSCRGTLMEDPETTWLGYKLNEEQRDRILTLTDDSFQSMVVLTEATGLTSRELEAAIEHPRARLRHLGSVKSGFYFRTTGS